jgi:NADPH:quinone reductase-like Zn-dependent oxidoreductase
MGGGGLVDASREYNSPSRAATVIATAAERNHALLRELGAIPVAYGPGLLGRVRAVAPDGISAAVHFVGTDEALDVSLEMVSDRTRIASIAGSSRRVEAGIKLLGYGPGQDAGTEVRTAARGDLVERAGSGALRVVIDRTFPLDEAAKALEIGIAGHGPGKLVLFPQNRKRMPPENAAGNDGAGPHQRP